MKKAFVLVLAICLFYPLSLLAATPKKGKVTSVVKNGLIIRTKPTSDSSRTGAKMWAGDTFEIKSVSGKWFQTTFKGVTGWVFSGRGYVEIIESDDDDADSGKYENKPRLRRSGQKFKVKKMKPSDKIIFGRIVELTATLEDGK